MEKIRVAPGGVAECLARFRKAGLSDRQVDILALRYGLGEDGRRWSLEEIGHVYGVTREAIRRSEQKAKAKLGDKVVAKLDKQFPKPESGTAHDKRITEARKQLKAYFGALKSKDPIQYADLRERFDLETDIPRSKAAKMTEVATCRRIMEQYRLTYFGRYRWCKYCDRVLPRDRFYPSKRNEGGIWTVCKECNPKKTLSWTRSHPEQVNANRREWYRRNPEKAAAASKRWHAKKKKQQKS